MVKTDGWHRHAMRVVLLLVAFLLAPALGLAGPAVASHGGCDGAVTAFLVVDDEATLYLDDRGDEGRWLYLESMDAPGLQRGGAIGDVVVDPCGDPGSADTLLAHVPDVA